MKRVTTRKLGRRRRQGLFFPLGSAPLLDMAANLFPAGPVALLLSCSYEQWWNRLGPASLVDRDKRVIPRGAVLPLVRKGSLREDVDTDDERRAAGMDDACEGLDDIAQPNWRAKVDSLGTGSNDRLAAEANRSNCGRLIHQRQYISTKHCPVRICVCRQDVLGGDNLNRLTRAWGGSLISTHGLVFLGAALAPRFIIGNGFFVQYQEPRSDGRFATHLR